MPSAPRPNRSAIARSASCCACLALVAVLLAAGVAGPATGSSGPSGSAAPSADEANVTEEAYVEPAPEPGDPYFEARAADDSWISYDNPRDKYRQPYLGDGSGKICVALVNEAGEPIVGETLPDTTVEIPTGESVSWHPSADPFEVELPMTENYERPLDSDQFGTSDLPQGDGYMDAHCMEVHGLPEDGTVEYGEATVRGAHADDLEVVGYVQRANEAWGADVDPIVDAEPYEEVGGNWTYEPGGSHGQVVAVLQLDRPDDGSDGGNESDDPDDSGEGGVEASERTDGDRGSLAAVPVDPGVLAGVAAIAAVFVAAALVRLR